MHAYMRIRMYTCDVITLKQGIYVSISRGADSVSDRENVLNAFL